MVALAASLLTALGCWAARQAGLRLGFLDVPDEEGLKTHRGAAVPLGGVGIFLGLHIALALGRSIDPGLLAASALILALGLFDDRRGLPPSVRLAGEGAAGLVLAGWASTPLAGDGLVGLLAGAALVVVAANAVNLFDGLDGLAGTAALVAGLGAAALATARGADPGFGLALSAALAGFLALNWHPARIFLGDNGAYLVGLLLAYAILGAGPEGVGWGLVVACGLLGVFVLDLSVTVIRRAVRGRPLFTGDRDHLYDRLRRRGAAVPLVALTAGAVEACFIVAVLGLDRLLPPARASLALGLSGLALAAVLWRTSERHLAGS